MKITLIGNGWGAESALKALLRMEVITIFFMSDDKFTHGNIVNIKDLNEIPSDTDLVICSGFTNKLNSSFLDKHLVINIHYSILPSYRGLHSTVWALLNNEKYLGLSIHYMNEYFDDGEIIYQFQVENDYASTSYYYMQVFNKHIEENLDKVVFDLLNGNIKSVKQDKSKASWVPRRRKEDCKIDFTKPISYQKSFFRALVKPYPLPYIEINKKIYNVMKVKFQSTNVISKIGCIVNLDDEGIWITCKDGFIVIQKLVDEQTQNELDLNQFKIGKIIQNDTY